MTEKISIYVNTHKRFCMPAEAKNSDIYIPILCGKAIYNSDTDEFKDNKYMTLPELGDDTGDNISVKNPYYSELTGMYWVWKNDKDSDIVGINHYRRYFANNANSGILQSDDILEDLETYDFLAHGPAWDVETWYNEEYSIYNGYKGMHDHNDFDYALDACKALFPDIYKEVEYEVKNSTCICMFNTMVCRKELYDKYCSFLFPIMFEVEERTNFDHKENDYQRRVLGFLSERFFRVWLMANHYKFKDQKVYTTEII